MESFLVEIRSLQAMLHIQRADICAKAINMRIGIIHFRLIRVRNIQKERKIPAVLVVKMPMEDDIFVKYHLIDFKIKPRAGAIGARSRPSRN